MLCILDKAPVEYESVRCTTNIEANLSPRRIAYSLIRIVVRLHMDTPMLREVQG